MHTGDGQIGFADGLAMGRVVDHACPSKGLLPCAVSRPANGCLGDPEEAAPGWPSRPHCHLSSWIVPLSYGTHVSWM